jgi:ADP-dependent NAD(P)H-hydrate dehydratase / NAD(P)H-hydrate epimerase
MLTPDFFYHWNDYALLTGAEMHKAEELSCARGPLDLYDLMRNAGIAVAQLIKERWQPCRVLVMCGPGNNGGDGYVAAEALRAAGWPVIVGAASSSHSPLEATRAASAWQGETRLMEAALFWGAELVIDALFGTGLQRALDPKTVGILDHLMARKLPVVAVDIPSGVDGDTGRVMGAGVQASVTVTFFRKKIGHVLLPGAALCGEVVVADIGIDGSVLEGMTLLAAENDPNVWRRKWRRPEPGDHKYTRGHVLVYGGPLMTGAARLAARAAQRIGAGLVTLGAPDSAIPLYAAALESVLVRSAESLDEWRELVTDSRKNVVLIGPGAELDGEKKAFVLEALTTRKFCVLDADALTLFSDDPGLLFKKLHEKCVLTPHEGEFARLFGDLVDHGADKLTRARKAAALSGAIVLLKGADTVIAEPQGLAVVNHNAPPWLATGGAGDVLSGMIAGLMAQGVPPFAAATAAASLHGRIAEAFGPGLIAEDLVDGIPGVLKETIRCS